MGLLPLEFTECLQDSPYFRDSLISHEKELERTSNNMKELIKEVKNLLSAARTLSANQRRLSNTLLNFKFECIGNQQTDDEIIIAGSLKEFGRLISAIEDEKERMLDQAQQFIIPLENFRKEHIGAVKEGKKKFDKQTAKFCASQERYLGLSRKKQDTVLQDADATLEMEQRDFIRAGLEYVCLIQEVQERKKFEFVETLLGFMYGWLTFYHHGHEVAKDYKPHMTELQTRIQKTRENFDASRADIQALMRKMLEVRQSKSIDPGTLNKMYTRSGYLFLMEKKAVLGTTSWNKCYCHYRRDDGQGGRVFCMIPYNQTTAKIVSTETFRLKSCVRRISDSIDKRFCFDIIPEDKPGVIYTFQALSEEDCELWLDAMDGKEPMYVHPPKPGNAHHTYLDEAGFSFATKCFQALDNRGLEDQGLYRVVGVTSKVNRLLTQGLDKKKAEKLNFDDPTEVESKTITSAVKTYLRNLPEPIMTYKMHSKFIAAAKLETYDARVSEVKHLTEQLPEPNKRMLELLSHHLEKVAINAKRNMMTVSNLGVCFGPTLLRNEEETVAAIMDIKFGNVVVEILIENWRQILAGHPPRKEPRIGAHSMKRMTSGSSLIVLPHSPAGIQLPENAAAKMSPMSNNNSQQPSEMYMKGVGNLSPGRPPPPPYFHPPAPGSAPPGLSPSTVIHNTNGPNTHFNNSSSGIVSSPQNYNSATWERPIHRGGALGSSGTAIPLGSHQHPHNNSTSSMSKLIVPPPLGSAPVGMMPTQQQLQQQYQSHRAVHATLSNSSAPLMRGSSTSSISASQDHLSQYHNSPTHPGYNPATTAAFNRTPHHSVTMPQGAAPPPPIKQRSFVHRRTQSGNNHNTSPPNHGAGPSPNRTSGPYSTASPPYVNASAAEVDLLNNSFGSDRGSNSGQITKQSKYHHAPPRHAPKQPPPPAPTAQVGAQLAQPPYIPPPQPTGPASTGNSKRKLSSEQFVATRSGSGMHHSQHHQNKGNNVDSEEAAEHSHNARSKRKPQRAHKNTTTSETSSSMESLTSGGGSSYGGRGMDHEGDSGVGGKGVGGGESSEFSSSRERIAQSSSLRASAESSPRQRIAAAFRGTRPADKHEEHIAGNRINDHGNKVERPESDEETNGNVVGHGVRRYGENEAASDNEQEQNDESCSDSGGGQYTNVINYPDRKKSDAKSHKNSSASSSAFKTAMLEAKNAVASSKDALRTASAAYGSPINIPQTATVQPLPQLQQQPQSTITGNIIRPSISSPSSSSSASSSAAPTQFNTVNSSTVPISSSPPIAGNAGDRVRTLYACVGEHESELSFEPNQIITGVRPSLEPGWLEGYLDGKIGLVPENYVEFVI